MILFYFNIPGKIGYCCGYNLFEFESKKRDIISKRWEIALKDYTPLNRLFIQRENILKNKKLIYNKDVNN